MCAGATSKASDPMYWYRYKTRCACFFSSDTETISATAPQMKICCKLVRGMFEAVHGQGIRDMHQTRKAGPLPSFQTSAWVPDYHACCLVCLTRSCTSKPRCHSPYSRSSWRFQTKAHLPVQGLHSLQNPLPLFELTNVALNYCHHRDHLAGQQTIMHISHQLL